VRQNNDMIKISALIAIAAFPTMLAGVWGMNFDHMPELNQIWGYPVALGLMAVLCTGLYRKFKKSGWL
ncbi:MAG: CorA family divalent cation transporter, partial [Acidimicrobiia bacterium]